MQKSYRRALLFVAVLVFLALTPVVLLYALGYQTSFSGADPMPVGVLLIETEPAQARVTVNGEFVGTTPQAVSNLRAGHVTVAIEKDGYATWTKQVKISPGRATEIRDIRLFPASLTPTTIATAVESFSLSPNRRLLAAVQSSRTLTVYDQVGEVVVAPHAFTGAIQSVLWSPNSDAMLVQIAGNNPFWYLPVTEPTTARPLLVLQQATGLVWDPRIPGRLLYLDAKSVLRAYNIRSQAQASLVPNVAAFATSASHLYTLPIDDNVLVEHTLQGQATSQQVPLPAGVVSQLAVTPQENIALRLDNREVWLLDDNDEFQRVASDINSVAWSPTGKVLLLTASDSSLYVYNVNDKRTTLSLHNLQLVQRLSRPITDPQWFAGSRHLIYSVDDAIWITEIDTRDHPMSQQIDTTNTGHPQATVGEEGEILFYLKKNAGVTTLVAAPLVL